MNELRIILARPITFSMRVLAAFCLAFAPLLDAYKDKDFSAVGTIAWIIIITSVLGQIANTVSAWFSTTVHQAHQELNGGTSPKEQS